MAAEEDIGVSGDMNQKMEWSTFDRIVERDGPRGGEGRERGASAARRGSGARRSRSRAPARRGRRTRLSRKEEGSGRCAAAAAVDRGGDGRSRGAIRDDLPKILKAIPATIAKLVVEASKTGGLA